jgi:site-specific DNA-methyltransferase (adenine-specific)
MDKKRAPRNRTITMSPGEVKYYYSKLSSIKSKVLHNQLFNTLLNQDVFEILDLLPDSFADLLFIDPPYNLSKTFNDFKFYQMNHSAYEEWVETWLPKMIRFLKPDGSVYICCDWKSSTAVFNVARKYLRVINRITWEREKGRGARKNWKNCLEDIWFCTVSEEYKFNIDAVKINRKVLAPYKNKNGDPKDWLNRNNSKVRITCPSNLWTDLTVPFWSMPENTDHPTQKPEKLLAKIILASSNEGDLVFDPFTGSGTTLVTAKKLNRFFFGVEIESSYAALALKRLDMAESDKRIQGYEEEVFWERNSIRRSDVD